MLLYANRTTSPGLQFRLHGQLAVPDLQVILGSDDQMIISSDDQTIISIDYEIISSVADIIW